MFEMPRVVNVEESSSLEPRAPIARPAPIPDTRLEVFFDGRVKTPIVKRAPSSSATSSASTPTKSCAPNDTRAICQKPVDATSNTTLPIVLGVVIPLAVALIVLVFLHRRHVVKLRKEDANDRHKSLDFGMEGVNSSDGKKKKTKKQSKAAPEMSMADTRETIRRGRGLSMDMDINNPFVLPPGLQQSRESLHSLSRAINNDDDKYRPATTFIPDDGSVSYPSSLRRGPDDSSSFTGSSRRGVRDGDSDQNILRHAQRTSRPGPATGRATTRSGANTPAPPDSDLPMGQRKPYTPPLKNDTLAPPAAEPVRDSFVSDVSSVGPNAALRASNNYLGAFIRGGFLSTDEEKQEPEAKAPAVNLVKSQTSNNAPRETERFHQPPDESGSDFNTDEKTLVESSPAETPRETSEVLGDNLQIIPPSPDFKLGLRRSFTLPELDLGDTQDHHQEVPLPDHGFSGEEQYVEDLDYDPRRSTMGVRPLPPDDPSENPEQRAIRIRSFYKEYFEEPKPAAKHPQPNYYDGSENFVNDDEEDYYDPEEEEYANPMFVPPRGASRHTGSEQHHSFMSGSSYTSQGPRAYSSASQRLGPPLRGPRRQKKLPPPAPLHVLPTPHMLKDDLFLPTDFAPPSSYRERRAGTPDSLKGGLRPFSPVRPAQVPLASSFDDLAVMPSP